MLLLDPLLSNFPYSSAHRITLFMLPSPPHSYRLSHARVSLPLLPVNLPPLSLVLTSLRFLNSAPVFFQFLSRWSSVFWPLSTQFVMVCAYAALIAIYLPIWTMLVCPSVVSQPGHTFVYVSDCCMFMRCGPDVGSGQYRSERTEMGELLMIQISRYQRCLG